MVGKFRPCTQSPLALAHSPPGQDLAGNTFWEFKDILNANRFRRIVKFDPKTHYSDVQVTRESKSHLGRTRARPWQHANQRGHDY